MFTGEKCLLYVVVLHHFKLTQKVIPPIDLNGKQSAVVLLLEPSAAIAQYVKNIHRVRRNFGTTNSVQEVLTRGCVGYPSWNGKVCDLAPSDLKCGAVLCMWLLPIKTMCCSFASLPCAAWPLGRFSSEVSLEWKSRFRTCDRMRQNLWQDETEPVTGWDQNLWQDEKEPVTGLIIASISDLLSLVVQIITHISDLLSSLTVQIITSISDLLSLAVQIITSMSGLLSLAVQIITSISDLLSLAVQICGKNFAPRNVPLYLLLPFSRTWSIYWEERREILYL